MARNTLRIGNVIRQYGRPGWYVIRDTKQTARGLQYIVQPGTKPNDDAPVEGIYAQHIVGHA